MESDRVVDGEEERKDGNEWKCICWLLLLLCVRPLWLSMMRDVRTRVFSWVWIPAASGS